MIDGLYDMSIKEAKMFVGNIFDKSLLSVEAHSKVKMHVLSQNIKIGDMVRFKDNDRNIKFRHNMQNDLWCYNGISIVEGFKKFDTVKDYIEEIEKNNESFHSPVFTEATSLHKQRYTKEAKIILDLFFPIYRIYVRPVGKHVVSKLRTKFVDKNEDGKFITLKDPVYDVISEVDEYYSMLDTGITFDSLILSTLTKDIDTA
jgi:hypothetical protein